MSYHENHCVVGYKLTKKGERFGEVKVVFEKFDSKLYPINKKEFFCHTEKVFITKDYEEIDNKYDNSELFFLEITGDSTSGECSYISIGSKATKLGSKDAIEVIKIKLPEVTYRKIDGFNYRPSTKYIFIEDEFLYGPFEYEVEENLAGGFYITLNTLAITLLNKGFPKGYICKIKNSKDIFTETIINGSDRKFILNMEELNNIDTESYDYRNDDLIIQEGNEILKLIGREFSKNQIRELKNDVINIQNLNQFNEDTINRFVPLFKEMEEWEKIANNMVQQYLESNQGHKHLDDYIENNKELYFKSIENEQKEKIESAIRDLRIEIELLEARKNGLNNEIEILGDDFRIEKNKLANVKPDESLINISEKYKEKEKDFEKINDRLNSLKIEYSHLSEIISLEQEISYLKRTKEEQRKEQAMLEGAHKTLKAQVAGDEDEIKRKLLEYKTYIDIIYTAKNDNTIMRDYTIKICQKEKNDKLKARKEYIDHIYNAFSDNGRDYKKDEIVNLIVSIQQSFITVLAGLPGVGKTSLVQYLGKALGLDNRLLNISVARGWTSQRDLLGYFNPLNGIFQPAPTGLYDLLQATSRENQNTQAPIYVLLDEANLSPIEHYWSNFMIMTDDENEKKLQTGRYGEDAEIAIPNALRFITTINYDNTTEALSPRLIDRSPIIKLRPERVANLKDKKNINIDFLAYSNQDLSNLFDVSSKENPELTDEEMEYFNKIVDVLQDDNPDYGQPIIVSQRKQLAIARYCHIARDNMIEEGKLRALDYAISQHILPLINGSGEQYGERLSKLLEKIPKNSFKLSYPQLYRIIQIGKSEIDTFNFFV